MAQCLFPYSVERNLYHRQEDKYVHVPCGKCPACLRRRLASWSHRLEIESLRWQTLLFVTLTYDPDHVPVSKNGFMTLDRSHLTNFFKRLRKRVGKMKYYAVGEYGTQNKRPHYHVILLANANCDAWSVRAAWRDGDTPIGETYFGDVTAGSIRYCVSYYDKGDWMPAHGRDDRIPEFSVMSQGIGRSFLTDKMVKHIMDNPDRPFIYDQEGKKIAIPRYYKKRIFDYVGSHAMVAEHPSLLIHRDEMLQEKKCRSEVISDLMSKIPQPEDTVELNENRKAAIINYRNSKRKLRK